MHHIIQLMIDQDKLRASNAADADVLPLNRFAKQSAVIPPVPRGTCSWRTFGNNLYGLPLNPHPAVLIYNDTPWKEAGVDLSTIGTGDEFSKQHKNL